MHTEYTKARIFKYRMLVNDVVALVLVFKMQTFVGLNTGPKHQNTNKLINSITKRKASYLNQEDQNKNQS